MKNLLTIVLLLFFILNVGNAQNVAINNDGTDANSDALLHLKSTTKGLVIPSMTTSQRTSISNVSNGLLVYDTQTNSFWFRDSGSWNEIVSGDIETASIEDNDGNTKIQVEESANDDEIRFDIAGEEKLVIKENAKGELLLHVVDLDNSYNTFLGKDAGLADDATGSFEGSWNTFIGYSSGKSNTIGIYNTFLGRRSGMNVVNGERNTYLGVNAGESNTSGENNVMLGAFTGETLASGSGDTYLGYAAGRNKTSGGENTFIGYEAGKSNSTGTGNIFIGYQAGFSTTNSDKLFIDNSSTNRPLIYGDFALDELQCNGDLFVNQNSVSNSTGQLFFKVNNTNRFSMGYETANDYFVIKDEENDDRVFYIRDGKVGIQRSSGLTNAFEVNGTASKSSAGDWLANSDARLKKNIENLNPEQALQKLLSLQGVTYEWDDDKTGNDRPEGIQYGFTAQNIQEIYPELVTEDNLGYLQTSYGTYDAMYVEAIRELLTKIETLEARVNHLENTSASTAAK